MGEDRTGKLAASGRAALMGLAGLSLAACATTRMAAPAGAPAASGAARGTMKPYEVGGVRYTPRDEPGYDQRGLASWYGQQFHHRVTADGEAFDMNIASAAHKTLPLPCIVEVTNLDNGRRIRVRVNDRGPFVAGRIIDLSRQGAKDLGFYATGTARVRVRYIGPAPTLGGGAGVRYAQGRASFAPSAPAGWAGLPRSGMVASARTAPDDRPAVAAAPSPPAEPGLSRIQVGAFADRANAERAAVRVAARGRTTIETFDRGGGVVYRVMVSCDQAGAAALRAWLAGSGFAGAMVVDPS